VRAAAQERPHTWPALGGSVIGRPAAIAAATYHRDRATSPLLVAYWNAVLVSLGGAS
jgi:hypothetical protein